MFQPTRPFEKWSRDRYCRVTAGGASIIVEVVVTSPISVVAAASAEIRVCGSTVVNCTLRSMAVGMIESSTVG